MLSSSDHFQYLTAARRRILDAVRGLTAEQYAQEFPFGLRSVRRTLLHMAGAEWFLMSQISGGPDGERPFSAQRVTDFAALESAWHAQEQRTIDLIQGERDWDRRIEFTVPTPGRRTFRVRASALQVFTQFSYHEVHHRSQVMAMLRQHGAPVETLDFLVLACEVLEDTRV
jgi:uncharacterized damage-inducible protein DinB